MRIRLNHITLAAVLFSLVGAGLLFVVFGTAQETISYEPTLTVRTGEVPSVSAKSFMVLDVDSGTEVVSKNSTDELPIASITKLFTAAAFKERTGLSGTTTVTWGDVATEGRSGKLAAGEVYPYNELVQAMMIESSNDAATTILRTDEGVLERMNEYPGELGFSHTSFADTSGLSDHNISTAYELASLTRHVLQHEPYLFDVSQQEEMIGTYTGWINNNPLIHLDGYKGGKHGFTYEAGKTVSAVFTERVGEYDRDFVYVLLDSDDLRSDIEQLRAYVDKQVTYQ